jgi:SHS2 domain-containing protein
MTHPETRGHATVDHTADQILEAWGTTPEECLEEAVIGLVASFAEVDPGRWWWHRRVELTGGHAEILVRLLEDVIYSLDTEDAVPVRIHVSPYHDGVAVDLWLTDLRRVTVVGPDPKGVSYSELLFGPTDAGRWRCRVIVDV